MNPINFIKSGTIKGALQATGRKLYEIRPEIMLVSGALSVFVGTIYACKKAKEAEKIVEETKNEVKMYESAYADVENQEGINLKEVKINKGKAYLHIYGKAAWEFGKTFFVPGLLWFGGMASIFAGHGDLRARNGQWIAKAIGFQQLLSEYRGRVAAAVGEETENKIFMGAQEGMVTVIETDPATGEEHTVQKKADVFVAQAGSIYARNFTEATSDAFDCRSYAGYFLDNRIEHIKTDLSLGIVKFYSGADILRQLGFNEDQVDGSLIDVGISGKGPELKVSRLQGYEEIWDEKRGCKVYKPCLRLDFNFYPLKGMI